MYHAAERTIEQFSLVLYFARDVGIYHRPTEVRYFVNLCTWTSSWRWLPM